MTQREQHLIKEQEAKRKKEHKEAWNENVETCSDCGIQWKKIGKSCPVCYAPAEKKEGSEED